MAETQIIWRAVAETNDLEVSMRPSSIDIELLGKFGKSEVEEAAAHLVRYLQIRDRWHKFSITELMNFYKLMGWDPNMMFFGLCGPWFDDGGFGCWRAGQTFLVLGSDGYYRVTDLFIKACSGNR